MRSRPIGAGQNILASQNNDRRDDSRGGSFLLVHQQLGTLALPTNPSNGNTTTVAINGTSIVVNWVTLIGSTANNVLIGASASASVNNLLNFFRRPDLTNSTQVAASSANQSLLQYAGWAYPGSATSIVPFSLNKNVNGIAGALTSFNITTTVTAGTWTAQTMRLYVEDGAYYIGTTRVLFTGGSTTTFTAPVSNPRIDLITADSSGTIALVTGTENARPVAPSYPANKAVLAEVYHVVGETALYDFENQQAGQGYISNDVRPTLLIPYISSLTQVQSGLFIQDPGSEAQGDLLYYNGAGAWARLPAGTSGQFLKTLGAGANPQWGAITVGETDGTASNQSLTATTSLQSDDVVITHSLGRTPAFIRLSCQVAPSNNPASGAVTGQMDMTYNGSGTAVAGFSASWLAAANSYAAGTFNFGGPATTFTVAGAGATAAATATVSITSISTTQFTIHITYQVTTGSGTLNVAVNNISWAVIG